MVILHLLHRPKRRKGKSFESTLAGLNVRLEDDRGNNLEEEFSPPPSAEINIKGNSLKDVVSFNDWIKDHSKLWHVDDPKYFAGPQHVWIDETVNVLKYENLKEDLNNFFNKEIDLPIINKSKRKDYLSYYNKESLHIVYEKHKEDFEKFNYKKL